MKIKENLLNILIAMVSVGIIILILFKFVLSDKPGGSVKVKGFENIIVSDLNGNKIKLSAVISKDESTYCFLFEMTDCYTCIYKGIEDLKSLKQAGKSCIGLMVHQNTDEVRVWASNYDFSPFFVMEKQVFYDHIQTQLLPVMIKVKDKKVDSFKYILP